MASMRVLPGGELASVVGAAGAVDAHLGGRGDVQHVVHLPVARPWGSAVCHRPVAVAEPPAEARDVRGRHRHRHRLHRRSDHTAVRACRYLVGTGATGPVLSASVPFRERAVESTSARFLRRGGEVRRACGPVCESRCERAAPASR